MTSCVTVFFKRIAVYLPICLTLIVALEFSSSASAQQRSLPLERFEVASDPTGFGSTEGGGILGHLELTGGGLLNYSLNPLVVVRTTGNNTQRSSIVSHRILNELYFAIGLFDYVQVAVAAPFLLFQTGDDLQDLTSTLGQSNGLAGIGMGDLRITPKVRLLNEKNHFINLALLAHLSLPTASGLSFNEDSGLGIDYGGSFLGNGPLGFGIKPEIAISANPFGLRLAANLGWRLRPTLNYLGRIPVTPEITYRAGIGYNIGQWIPGFTVIPALWNYPAKQNLLIYFEVFGATGDSDPFGAISAFSDLNNEEKATRDQSIRLANAAEWSLGTRWNVYKGWNLEAAVGTGILPGFGTPDLRLWAGIRYIHEQHDRDQDGILDDQDQCIYDAEDKDGFEDTDGCPDYDNDNDQVLDEDDQCPKEQEDQDRFEDTDGCPDYDNDQDGIVDVKDACPNEAGIESLNGCPKRDRDQDGILDADDQCPDEAGPKKRKGCPEKDQDKDGILDENDECPKEAGPKERKGCPFKDQDKDGVEDKDDQCPNVPGPKERKGCPAGDKDGDGITDDNDKCPTKPGPKERKGCPIPDKDGDGIEDSVDACPLLPGPAVFKGCPDTDGDGIEDKKDKCPKEAGKAMFDGCNDKDEDGIPDYADKCPTEKETINGIDDDDGCPDKGKKTVIIRKEKIEINQRIYFATGKAKIQSRSFPLLDQIALTLKATPRIKKIRIEGHTDSQGSSQGNQALSERRANAVRSYLIRAGLSSSRLQAAGIGEEQPIDTNNTPAGRQNNRRVEFVILD